MAISVNRFSISFATTPMITHISIRIKGEADLKKAKNLFISLTYLKKLSTNSYLLNTCKSSMPSPTPMYFTGI